MAPAKQDSEIYLAQRLASNETFTRTKALKTLKKYITVRSQKIEGGFTSADLLKIWKGLFYCLWMQDKPLLQEELSDKISRLMHSFCTTDSQLLYFETFLQTVKREWNGIDRLRMDKFFQLVRFVFRQAFEMLKRREWDTGMVNQFLEVFTAQLLQSREGVPDGLVLHILDVYMTELAKAGSAELTSDQNFTFIDPFCKVMAKSKDRLLVISISKHIFSTIVDQSSFAIEELMKELFQGEEADSDSGQTSEDEEETVEQDEVKMSGRAKNANGIPENSNQGRRDEILDMEDAHHDEKSNNEDTESVLQFDYAAIADRLFELGSHKKTPNFNRTRMYNMVKIFRDLNEGVFPQNDDEDACELDSSDELFNQKNNKKKRKKKQAEEGKFAKKHKTCEVVKPTEANQMHVMSTSEREDEGKSHAQDNKSKAQDDEPHLQMQVKANLIKDKKRKGKKQKSDILEVGKEAAPESHITSKDMDKELIGGDEEVKKHPSPKTVAEDSDGMEQALSLSNDGRKSGKNQAGKPTPRYTNDHLENILNPAPLKKKKSLTAGGAAVKMVKDAKVSQKRCADERTEDPRGVFPVEMPEDQTDGTACILGKKTKHKKKIITEPSNTTASLLLKKKTHKSKMKTQETISYEDVNVTSDCAGTKMNCTGLEKADTVKLSELRSKKKGKKKKLLSSEEQVFGTEMEQSVVNALHTVQTNTVKQSSCTSIPHKQKNIQKRKMQLVECQTGGLSVEAQLPEATCVTMEHEDVSMALTPKKKLKLKKASQGASFISFQGEATPPTPLFCKTKPKGPSSPVSGNTAFHTPQSETKKVTFGLKNNKTTEFRKTDWSLLVSPVGSSRVAFDPKKMPVFGVLKSPTLSPGASVRKPVSKRRPTAADFF